MHPFLKSLRELPLLCQGHGAEMKGWLENPTGPRILACLAAIAAGGAAYGFTLGLWRAPLMGGYVAVKLPLLIFLTLLTNGLLNGMLSQLLGSGLGFRQTLLAMLMSFAGFSLITAALSPVALMMVLDAPSPGEPGARESYRAILLVHTAIIAFAGVTAHRRFYPILAACADTPAAAARVFVAWLAGNLFVGAQLSWNLRPFFGQPARDVSFLRPDWNRSSFYESIYHNLGSLFRSLPGPTVLPVIASALVTLILAVRFYRFLRTTRNPQ